MGFLRAKAELFAQGIFNGLSGREAYKQAGYAKQPDGSLDACASRLLKNAKVQLRLAEMADDRALMGKVTAQTVTKMLADTYKAATKDRQHGAAATAAMGIAKLHGLLVDKIEDVTRKPARSPDAPLQIEVDAWLAEHQAALDVAPTLDLEPRLVGHESPLPDEKILKSGSQDHQNNRFGSETIGALGLGARAADGQDDTSPETVIDHNDHSSEPKGSQGSETVIDHNQGSSPEGSEA